MVLYNGLDPDDDERLNALASNTSGNRKTFDEAFNLLTNGSTRQAAKEAWDAYVAYWDGNTDQ